MKLIDILNESEERGLSNEVKKHFLEIISTYNTYQEQMGRKSDIIKVAETLGGITEAARELALRESDDWFDKHTIKRNMSELDKLGKQFDKVANEAKALDQRMTGLYEDMGNVLSRYYKIGEVTEEEMKERLGLKESKGDCGCGCGGVTEGGCGDTPKLEEEQVAVSTRDSSGNITTRIKEGMFGTIDQIRQDSKDVRDFVKNVFADRDFKKMKNDKDFIKYLKSIYEGTVNEGPSTEEKRIAMLAVRKQAKYRNVDMEQQYKTKLTLLWIYKEMLKKVRKLNKKSKHG
tara:strand:- start:109 stop:975 length:867 start_codon:yes stop_codon:yes gene_type:complete